MASIKPKIAPTGVNVNDALQDLTVVHAINLERLKASETAIVMDILDDLGLSVQKQLEKIDPTGVGPTYRARRLARLEKTIKATTALHYKKIKSQSASSLAETAKVGAKATANGVNSSLGVSLGATLPPPVVLRELAGKTLVQGEQVKAYWDEQFAGTRGNFVRQMRMGVAGGEALPALVARVRGTKDNNFTDGIMTASKRKAEALVRTSVSAVNNAAAVATIEANGDLFNGVQWLATLDTRTSDICKARSGLTWDENYQPVGHAIAWSPPPAHFNCRSTIIGVLKSWDELANKKLPAVGAETLQKELTKSMTARGLSPLMIEKALYKTQQSMDGFVAGDLNFEDWLKRKPEGFQKDILGEGKWNLWNAGKISFVDLVDQKSMPRSLAEIQALVDAGDTSILKANKAAKAAAKAEAAAAELAAKAAAKAENEAQGFIDDLLAGVGGVNATKVLKKLDTDGLTATQIKAKVDEGVAQISLSANISKAKKKFKEKGEGAKLSKTEAAAWATVDDDLKAAFIAGLESEAAVYKQLDQLIDKAAKEADDLAILGGGDGYLAVGLKQFDEALQEGNDYILSKLTQLVDDPSFVKNLKGVGGIDSLKAAKKMTKADAEGFVAKFNLASAQMVEANKLPTVIKQAASDMADNYVKQTDNYLYLLLDKNDIPDVKAQVGILEKSSVVEYYLKNGPNAADDLASLVTSKLQKEVTLQNEAFKALAEAAAKAAKAAEALAAKQADEAMDKLAEYETGGKGLSVFKKAYDQLVKTGKMSTDKADATQMVAAVETLKDQIQAQASLASVKSGIKKKFAAGKKLSPSQQQVFDDLDQVDKDALTALGGVTNAVEAATATIAKEATEKAAKRASDGVQFDDLEQIGEQGGSNVGGTFRSKVDGTKYYVKAPRTDDHVKNEVLGMKLYKLAGLDAPEVDFIRITGRIGNTDFDNKLGLTSKIVDNMEQDGARLASGSVTGVADGFATDAWLANWDVVGEGYDNLKILGDKAIRVEAGGSLRYRAMGGKKAGFNDVVDELDSLRNGPSDYNNAVFRNLTEEQIVNSVQRVVNISDAAIKQTVEEIYGVGDDIGDELIDTLIARKAYLAEKYKKQLKPAKPAPVSGDRVSDLDEKTIKNSRANGHALQTDKDQIEDQEVHVAFLKDANNNDTTRLSFKLMGSAAKKFDRFVKGAPKDPDQFMDFADLDDVIEKAFKNFNSKHTDNLTDTWAAYQSNVERLMEKKGKEVAEFADELNKKGLDGNAFYKEFGDRYDQVVATIIDPKLKEGYAVVDKFPIWAKPSNGIEIPKPTSSKKTKKEVVSPFKDSGSYPTYNRSSFNKSFETNTGDNWNWQGKHWDAEVDGIKIRYFPTQKGELAMSNRIEVLTAGASKQSVKKILDKLEEFGIDTSSATALDVEEMYLRKIAFHNSSRLAGSIGSETKFDIFKAEIDAINKIKDQSNRVDALAGLATKLTESKKDIRKLPNYNAAGEPVAYGQGRRVTYRPEMTGKVWDDTFKEHYIYHDLEYGGGNELEAFKNIVDGGGQLISTSEKLRRGLQPSDAGSPEEDTRTGGASYVFTRFFRRSRVDTYKGLYWKPDRIYKRTDSAHYSTDYYGSQAFSKRRETAPIGYEDFDFSRHKRAVTPADAENFNSGNNEVIFKETLPIFDDLQCFVVRQTNKAPLIEFMKSRGYKTWPDGRKLSDVIVTADEAEKLGYAKNG
jgi:SPP1 gp7 family putative phage head morphogenesis protein